MNKAIIIGRLGADPELKYTPSGAAVCNMSVATTENWTNDKGEAQEKTNWHRVVVWGKKAENCGEYLSKGRQVAVEGKMETRDYEDKTGVKRYFTEIIVNGGGRVEFLGSAPKKEETEKTQS